MHDPFPLSPPAVLARNYVQPFADRFGLKTLPLHYHEVILAFLLYHFTNKYIAPTFSRFFFPRIYPTFSARTKLNWDVHIVSFVQSTLINILALYVIWTDEERGAMSWQEKVWGYTGASGLIQGFAAGYFVWDLVITLQNVKIFGLGMLAHAVSAVFVFSLGFRPFVNFYAPTFILYELSSPFLNIHWFCDKLDLTGSTLQFINGIILLATFAGSRLIYGTYASFSVCKDLLTALQHARNTPSFAPLALSRFALNATTLFNNPAEAFEVVKYAPLTGDIPAWMAGANVLSNVTLNILNWYWYSQMVSAIRKRFDPPFGTRRKVKSEAEVSVARGKEQGRKTVTVSADEVRRRPQAFKRLQTGEMPPAPA